jgi:hypothetical protein
MRRSEKGLNKIIVIAVLAIVLVVGLVGWAIYNANKQNQANDNSQAAANAGYVVIQQWSVRFKPVDGLLGIQSYKPQTIAADVLAFTTNELASKEPRCGTSNTAVPLGLLSRSDNEPSSDDGQVVAIIGDYVYQYRPGDTLCSVNSANYDLENKTNTAILQSLKSLETAK